ncbi:YqzE family protein [Bacillus aerolatus]|uniref:YqzE family protein n=1 Tax=Bacillus aerolatus TaxID=2653354 RepID=A0A6I1FQ17_9BACI|nr:YqzE family protein [Bacillus aerolatus]KAB7708782.1 YqzE family protein [Bacillus aerolatus]
MNEYVKYFMETFLSYLNEPKQVRKEKRQRKQAERSAFSSRWFGLLPWALRQLFNKK